MSDDHNHPNYMLIWIVLLVLTVLEVLVAFFPGWLSGVPGIHLITILLLVVMAFVKAGLVAWYFMHLKFERNWKYVLLAPTFILACGLPLALLPDIGVHYYEVDVPQNSIADRVSVTPEETKSSGETAVPH